MTAPEDFTFSSQRLTLSGAAWGEPGKPLCVLVHGGLDQKHSWDWTARALCARYRVVAFDLRGHGKSEWVNDGDYAIMDHVYDLASLIDHLEGDDVRLVGHSLGGNIVLRYSGIFPERINRVASIEGMGSSPNRLAARLGRPADIRLRRWIDSRRDRSVREPRRMNGFDEALSRMTGAHGRLSEEYRRHLTKTGLREHADGSVSWAYDPAVMGRSPADLPTAEFIALLKRIDCPVWLAYGANSWASNPADDGRIAWFAKEPALTLFEEAGHWLHHDRFETFIEKLSGFLEG